MYVIYLFLTVLQMILMILFGWPVFDSINLTFATAGTGGFSVLNSGCADYNTAVQIILTVFMILFGVNFNGVFLIYCKKWKEAVHCEEVRAYLGIIAAAVIMISFNICHIFGKYRRGRCFTAAFQVASIITTTVSPAWTLTFGRNFPGRSCCF